MAPVDNETTFKRFVDETMNRKNVAAIDELTTPDFVEHEPLPPGFPEGREGTKLFFSLFLGAFPDLHAEVEDVIEQGDKLAARVLWTGTQNGEFMGAPASGKSFRMSGIDWVRIADGRIAEHWGASDQMGMLRQLGLMPGPGP